MISAEIKLANNRLVKNIGKQRIAGNNRFFPICALSSLQRSYQAQNPASAATGRDIFNDHLRQLDFACWLHDRTGISAVHPCMDLNLEAGAVARANNFDDCFKDADQDQPLEVVPFLPENTDFSKLRVPSPDDDPLMSDRLAFFSGSKQIDFGNAIRTAWIIGPYSLSAKIMDPQKLSTLSHMAGVLGEESDEAKQMNACFDYATSCIKAYAQALESAGAQAIVMLGPAGGCGVITPDNFGKSIVPRINAVIDSLDIPLAFHACGDTARYFDAFAMINAEGFSLDREVDLMKMHRLRPDAMMIGNFDNTTMHFRTPFEICRAALSMSKKYAELDAMGKWWPGTGCEITSPVGTDRINMFAMAVHPSARYL